MEFLLLEISIFRTHVVLIIARYKIFFYIVKNFKKNIYIAKILTNFANLFWTHFLTFLQLFVKSYSNSFLVKINSQVTTQLIFQGKTDTNELCNWYWKSFYHILVRIVNQNLNSFLARKISGITNWFINRGNTGTIGFLWFKNILISGHNKLWHSLTTKS